MYILIFIVFLLLLLHFLLLANPYDLRGFNSKGLHRNGTKYDDFGYDVHGYDKNGYNRDGYNQKGYDINGYNVYGYNKDGRNQNKQYNRMYDTNSETNSFYNIKKYPFGITIHARERMMERMPLQNSHDIDKIAYEAYCYGKSKRQVRKSSVHFLEAIENRHDNSNVLIYHGYIYIFSKENVLITVYKNDHIPL